VFDIMVAPAPSMMIDDNDDNLTIVDYQQLKPRPIVLIPSKAINDSLQRKALGYFLDATNAVDGRKSTRANTQLTEWTQCNSFIPHSVENF